MKLAQMNIAVHEGRIREKTQALDGSEIYSAVCYAKHDKRLGIVPVQLQVVALVREARGQGEYATRQLLGHGSKFANLVALEAPDGLPVAVFEVQRDAHGHVIVIGTEVRKLLVQENGRGKMGAL